MRIRSVRIPAAAFLFAGLASAGTVTTITSVTNPTVSTFAGDNSTFDSSTAYTNNGATFNASDTVFMYPVYLNNNVADISNLTGGKIQSLNISLSAAATQFGFNADDTFSGAVNPAGFQIASVFFFSDAGFVNGTDTYATSTLVGQDSFFGLQNTTPFQSLEINFFTCAPNCGGGDFSPYLDDFQVGTSLSSAPEPGSASILLSGLGLLAASMLAFRCPQRIHRLVTTVILRAR